MTSQTTTVTVTNTTATATNTDWFGSRNTLLPALDSAGFTLCLANAVKALPMMAAMNSATDLNEGYWMSTAGARTYFREVCFLSWAAANFNLIEAIFWSVIGLVCLPFGKKEPTQEAIRTAVKAVSNLFFATVGFVGMIYPKWGYKVILAAGRSFAKQVSRSEDYAVVERVFVGKIAGAIQGGAWLTGLVPENRDQPNPWIGRIQRLPQLATFASMQANPNAETLKAYAVEVFTTVLPHLMPLVVPYLPAQVAAQMRQAAAARGSAQTQAAAAPLGGVPGLIAGFLGGGAPQPGPMPQGGQQGGAMPQQVPQAVPPMGGIDLGGLAQMAGPVLQALSQPGAMEQMMGALGFGGGLPQ